MTDIPSQWFGDGPGEPAPASTPEWFDDDAGPLVRLYAMTGGRARPTSEVFDLIAVISAGEPNEDAPALPSPEHASIVARCRAVPTSVADIAADSGLPIGVVRVLLGDLLDAGRIQVSRPVPAAELPDAHILEEVIDGLRAL
ncbi:MAG: DUF742 domain-containing protein [Streptomyces sp.]|uniref:DUF742 domain-containing protein n=1 Tax=Streptomyces sp. TaxID=1931 RepID=UPI003D6BEDCC